MNPKSWIINALKENNLDKTKVYLLYEDFQKEVNSLADMDTFKRAIRKYYEVVAGKSDIEDYDEETVLKLEAKKQRLQDINNVITKSNREQYRLHNSLEEIYTEYIDLLKKVDMTKFKIKELKPNNNGKVGILQLSDWHLNELIYENENATKNSFDMNVASKRLKKLVTEAIALFKFKKIDEVSLLLSGDLINSSRRLGESLAQATSLVSASLMATYFLQQIIIELSKHFSITVYSVVGNESRIAEIWDSTSISAQANYDFLIFNNLRMIFDKTPVKFDNSENSLQVVVKLSNGFNALLVHGNSFKSSNSDKDIAKLIQTYVWNGVPIHAVFSGHYHNASVSDFTARSSSLCGANAYSSNDLNYLSRASQNIYIANSDLGFDGYKIDLQNADNEGYTIIDLIERYNVRSAQSNTKVTIDNLA